MRGARGVCPNSTNPSGSATTLRHDRECLTCEEKLTDSKLKLLHGTEKKTEKTWQKTKSKNRLVGCVIEDALIEFIPCGDDAFVFVSDVLRLYAACVHRLSVTDHDFRAVRT